MLGTWIEVKAGKKNRDPPTKVECFSSLAEAQKPSKGGVTQGGKQEGKEGGKENSTEEREVDVCHSLRARSISQHWVESLPTMQEAQGSTLSPARNQAWCYRVHNISFVGRWEDQKFKTILSYSGILATS